MIGPDELERLRPLIAESGADGTRVAPSDRIQSVTPAGTPSR